MGHVGPSRSVVILGPLSRRINRFVIRVAGRGRVGPLAKIHHRGRRTGREYAVPVIARPVKDTFLVPLFFGPDADWCRNVLAAPDCRIDWHGDGHLLHRPQLVGAAELRVSVRAGFWLPERLVFRLAGIRHFLVLDRHSG